MNSVFEPIVVKNVKPDGWIRIVQAECLFEQCHFKIVMQLFINEPNVISPCILRAEIIQQQTIGNGIEYHRKLVPVQDRDPVIVQKVIDSGSVVEHCVVIDDEIAGYVTLPFFYPKFQKFRYVFESGMIAIDVVPYPDKLNEVDNPKTIKVWNRILTYIHKFGHGTMQGYQKKVYHDQIVPKIAYQDLYRDLKKKYKYWVQNWPEETDPQKHVFEDIGIAAFLILLWKQSTLSGKEFQFVDLGTGNGFLTYILTQEGYKGYGIDLSKRKLWDLLKDTDLRVETIDPSSKTFDNVEWIIGNHPDELTLWIPLIAAKADDTKYVIIPCCAFKLDGKRFSKSIPELGKYKTFCKEIDQISNQIGFQVEREVLRIPSTKNQCIIGRKRNEIKMDLVHEFCKTPVELRKSDREKSFAYLAKQKARKEA
jgi:SAM-dependent methyltransferase